MAISKLLVFSIFLSLLFFNIRADAPIEDGISSSDGSDSALKAELDQLKSKISDLESNIANRNLELKIKDESIARMEKIIQEKSNAIAVLRSNVESLQKKGTSDAEELIRKAYARGGELEKQLERINEEQKTQIRKTERALQVAEEEMMKVKLDATSKSKELTEIHGAWLPPWFATHLIHFQSFTVRHWNEYGRPVLDVTVQKASEKSAQAKKWAEPHLETVKTRWVPALKGQWLELMTSAEPYVQLVTTRTLEFYESSKTTLTPHVVKVQEIANPYFQEAKKFSKPYIDQVATVTKPHVDKVRVALKPYTKKAVHVSQKFLKSATEYHDQVQGAIHDTLKKNEVTKSLATKELVWFMASALLALPVFFLFKLCSEIFWKKGNKPRLNANTNPATRKHKRRHADK